MEIANARALLAMYTKATVELRALQYAQKAFNHVTNAEFVRGHLTLSVDGKPRKCGELTLIELAEYIDRKDAVTAIRDVVNPQKKDAMDAAEKLARADVEKVREQLAAHDWDIHAAFPLPKEYYSKEYKKADANRAFARRLTIHDANRPSKYRYMRNGPEFVVMRDELVKNFIDRSQIRRWWIASR